MCETHNCAESHVGTDGTTLLRSNVEGREHKTLTVKKDEMAGFKKLVETFAIGRGTGHQETREYSDAGFTITARADGGAEIENDRGGFSLDPNKISGFLNGIGTLRTDIAHDWKLVQTAGHQAEALV